MGGPGSGNRWRSNSGVCEHYRRIDLAYLRKHRMLTPGNRYNLRWTRGDEASGNIGYVAARSHLTLEYSIREYGDTKWEEVRQILPLEWMPLHYGGQRPWFNCPRCRRRCRILYGGARYYCRKCYRLKYESQSEEAWQRQITKSQRIRQRLGGDGSIDDFFPLKPKGMHWGTYRRLEAIDERAQELWAVMVTGFISRFEKG